jgi:hypothetical protein
MNETDRCFEPGIVCGLSVSEKAARTGFTVCKKGGEL